MCLFEVTEENWVTFIAMEKISHSIDTLTSAIDNFEVGAALYEKKPEFGSLKQAEDAYKLRRSKALLESAYREQHHGSVGDISSSLSLEKPRLLKREKIRNECQQSAIQGMVSSSVLQNLRHSWSLRDNSAENDNVKEIGLKSKLYEYMTELSMNSRSHCGERYNDVLVAEKSVFDELLRFQEVFSELKKGKRHLTDSTSDDRKMKLSMAQKGLDKVNLMRRLIVLLVAAKDVDLSENKVIADIVINKCNHLTLHDLKH